MATTATPDALICTVGVSMLAGAPEIRELSVGQAASRLAKLGDASRAGAEHQNIVQYLDSPDLLEPRALHLVTSDTDEGQKVADVLACRFRSEFEQVKVERVTNLRDDRPKVFATSGLRSLANRLVEATRDLERQGLVPAIDATGGYKPQIAYAVLIGQVMQVRVYYRYSGFARISVLQPLPISVDATVWLDHLWFFDQLRRGFLKEGDIPQQDPRVAPLLLREDHLVTLSALGEIMQAAVDRLLSVEREQLLPPPNPAPVDSKEIKYEKGNSGKHRGLSTFCERLVQVPYVTRVASVYFNPDLSRKSHVLIPRSQRQGELEVLYGDGSAVTKLLVGTTATNEKQLAAAQMDLSERLKL